MIDGNGQQMKGTDFEVFSAHVYPYEAPIVIGCSNYAKKEELAEDQDGNKDAHRITSSWRISLGPV